MSALITHVEPDRVLPAPPTKISMSANEAMLIVLPLAALMISPARAETLSVSPEASPRPSMDCVTEPAAPSTKVSSPEVPTRLAKLMNCVPSTVPSFWPVMLQLTPPASVKSVPPPVSASTLTTLPSAPSVTVTGAVSAE